MKNILLTAIASISIATITTAQVPSYIPTNGLLGYWSFSGNANDQSVNGNNGTVTGATLTNDRYGNTNSAYLFNGTSDFISVGYVSTFNSYPLTLSTWIKTNSTQRGGILSKYISCSNNGYAITSGIGGEISAYYFSQNGSYINLDAPTTFTINNNSWQMISVVFDNDSAYLYSNNSLSSKYKFSTLNPNAPTTTTDLYFGRMLGGTCDPDLFYNGQIDDAVIWNRALTQNEIAQIYNSATVGIQKNKFENLNLFCFEKTIYLNSIPNIKLTLKLIDLTGKIIYNDITKEKNKIDVSNGLYIVNLVDENNNIILTKKIIIE